jgi:hypothetical protein
MQKRPEARLMSLVTAFRDADCQVREKAAKDLGQIGLAAKAAMSPLVTASMMIPMTKSASRQPKPWVDRIGGKSRNTISQERSWRLEERSCPVGPCRP